MGSRVVAMVDMISFADGPHYAMLPDYIPKRGTERPDQLEGTRCCRARSEYTHVISHGVPSVNYESLASHSCRVQNCSAGSNLLARVMTLKSCLSRYCRATSETVVIVA